MNAPEWYVRDYGKYMAKAPEIEIVQVHEVREERSTRTTIDGWNFYQDMWAFNRVLSNRPEWLLDVGSNVTLVGILAQCMPVKSVEIRPLAVQLDTLECMMGTITDLPFDDGMVPMAMSLSVIEHVGLGRYGDAIDPYGSVRACMELERVLQPGGHLLISCPVNDVGVTLFNEHRLLERKRILGWLGGCKLENELTINGPGLQVWCAEFVKR